jgi:hypothetical protein
MPPPDDMEEMRELVLDAETDFLADYIDKLPEEEIVRRFFAYGLDQEEETDPEGEMPDKGEETEPSD